MKGVIAIAGYGTRFLPASKAIPKEMIPLVDVPLIQYHVESLVASGISEIIIVIREKCEAVQKHFAPDPDLEQHLEQAKKPDLLERVQRVSSLAEIMFVHQPETLPYGNASPALAARPWLTPGEPFYYMFGDDVFIGDTPVPKQMMGAFNALQPAALVAVQQVPYEDTPLYGCIQFKSGSVDELKHVVEKPVAGSAPSNWVQTGHFIFTPELFSDLDASGVGKGGELWMADAVDRLAARRTVIVKAIIGEWLPAGDPLHHLKANIAMHLLRPDLRDRLVAYLRSLNL